MGGAGSGKPRYVFGKGITCDYRHIDIRRWQRDGLLVPNQYFSLQWSRDGEIVASIEVMIEEYQATLAYRYRDPSQGWQSKNYSVMLDWTPCNYGGERPWFCCPARGCRRRVAILYCGRIFACRHCHQLVYASQGEPDCDRAMRRADKIRKRLGWEPGILNSKGGKPKGMHWRTFDRLTGEHDALVDQSLAGVGMNFRMSF